MKVGLIQFGYDRMQKVWSLKFTKKHLYGNDWLIHQEKDFVCLMSLLAV